MVAITLEEFLRTRTRPYPFPWEAVHVLGHFTMRNLILRDGFVSLDQWFDEHSARLAPRRLRAYLAAPLFSEAERRFNRELKRKLSPWFDVFLPQEDVGLLADFIARGMSRRRAMQTISEADSLGIQSADVIIAVLDGRTIDEGVVDEIAEGWYLRKPCYGLQTDSRRLQPSGNNLRVECKLQHIFASERNLLRWARKYCERTVAYA